MGNGNQPRRSRWTCCRDQASNEKRTLHNGRRIVAASNTLAPVEHPPTEPQLLKSALKETATPTPKEDTEDRLGGLVGGPALGESPSSRIRPIWANSSARLGNILCEQIPSISVLAEHAVVRLFGDLGRETESSTDTKVTVVVETVINRSVSKAFWSSAFKTRTNKAVQKWLTERHVDNNVATRTIDIQAFTVSVAKFVKNQIHKRCLEKAKLDQYKNLSRKDNRGSKDNGGRKVSATMDGRREIPKFPDGYIRRHKDESEGVRYLYVFGRAGHPLC